jgi:ATP-dependent DNA helicase RecQ
LLTETDTCRESYLLSYFGEDTSKDCGHCDVCISRSSIPATYEQLATHLTKLLSDRQGLTIKDITRSFTEIDTQHIVVIVRDWLDSGKLIKGEEGLISLKNYKLIN